MGLGDLSRVPSASAFCRLVKGFAHGPTVRGRVERLRCDGKRMARAEGESGVLQQALAPLNEGTEATGA